MTGTGVPRLSVVLATDRYETIRGVVRAYARQSVASSIEIVLVGPEGLPAEPPAEDVGPLHSVRAVRVDRVPPLAPARAAGVRATRAPVVTVGETHAFPEPGFAAAILAAFDAGADALVPGFANANPDGALSWAGLILDYGIWSRVLPAGRTRACPAYHTVFRREFAEGLGDRLDDLYVPGFDAAGELMAAGLRIRHEPAAVTRHVNASTIRAWTAERFVAARVQAGERAARWGRGRRLAYVLGSPLIVPLMLVRGRAAIRTVARREGAPPATLPAILTALILKAAGEAVGFAIGARDRDRRRSEDIEVHKLSFVRGAPAAR